MKQRTERSFLLLPNSPRRRGFPAQQLLVGPVRRLVGMARRTRVRHLVLVCHCRGNELKCVGTDKRAGHALRLDLRHVAGNALVAGAAILMVRVLFQARGMRPVG